jgi:hypothetical protein
MYPDDIYEPDRETVVENRPSRPNSWIVALMVILVLIVLGNLGNLAGGNDGETAPAEVTVDTTTGVGS